MKEYIKPELEIIAFVADEPITNGDLIEGSMGLGDNIFDP